MKPTNDAVNVAESLAGQAQDMGLVSVVVPVHNGSSGLQQSLKALTASRKDRCEIIVVDDHSTEDVRNIAERHGARYFRTPGHGGPAAARNLGAKYALGDIIVFVDSDVLVPPNALRIIIEEFEYDPDIAALFGSYDDTPACLDFWSSFKNLMHHHVHQSSRSDASTFWTGCGAIRKQAFKAVGGFDAVKYTNACIEDIELGFRLTQQRQRIRLVKRLQVKHLKKWTLRSVVQTDVFQRALPWTQLILTTRSVPRDLNLTWTSRVSATLVGIMAVLITGLVAGLVGLTSLSRVLATGLVLATTTLLLLNRELYSFFWRKRGSRFASGAILAHWLYLFYSGIVFLFCFAAEILQDRLRSPTIGPETERLRRNSDRLVSAD